MTNTSMGVARIFFRGGGTISKKFSKNVVKNFVKILKKFAKIFKKIQKFFKKISKIFKNFQKYFFIKMLKIDFLSIFFKKFNKPSIQFLRV